MYFFLQSGTLTLSGLAQTETALEAVMRKLNQVCLHWKTFIKKRRKPLK